MKKTNKTTELTNKKKTDKKATDNQSFEQLLNQLTNILREYFGEKAPLMPENIQDFLVKVTPWLIIIGLFFGLPALLAALGINFLLLPVRFLGRYHSYGYGMPSLSILVAFVSLTIEAFALPGLFKKTHKAWNLIYWAALVNLIGNLLTGSMISFIISGLISFYLLFQIENKYKN